MFGIIKDGHLVAGKSKDGQGHDLNSRKKVFLQAVLEKQVGKPIDDLGIVDNYGDNICLVLDPNILEDRSDYHFSVGWEYGAFSMDNSYGRNQKKSFLKHLSSKRDPTNEIVFDRSIPLFKYLVAIWVTANLPMEELRKIQKRVGRNVQIIKTPKIPSLVIDIT